MNAGPKGLKFEAWCGGLPAIQTPETEAGDELEASQGFNTDLRQDTGGRKGGLAVIMEYCPRGQCS